jgi:predicted RNA binding protein YcfA (HicA-like mRNA interferase family)
MGRTVVDVLEQARRSPTNVRFTDLCRLVEAIGYLLRRQKGSHRIFANAGRPDLPIVNLQSDGAKAKAKAKAKTKTYQVRQVVRLIEEYQLEMKS